MKAKSKIVAASTTALVIAGAAATVSAASMSDDRPLAGTDLDRASAAALEHTGGGTVVDSEAGDGGAAYEVEVRTADGQVVDVLLDARFQVSGSNVDDDLVGGGVESGDSEGAETDG